MKKQYFEYEGYTGSVNFSIEDDVLFGKIEFINDLVNYEAATLGELKKEFIAAVDDYLDTCKEIGKQPEKTMSGTFNVRVGSIVHKRLAVLSFQEDKSINDIVKTAVTGYLDKGRKEFHLHLHGDEVTTKQNYDIISKELTIPRWDTEIAGNFNYQLSSTMPSKEAIRGC